MKLLLQTVAKQATYTIGKLFIDGEYFCDTLEDTVRELGDDGSGKVYAKTAIPPGEYIVKLTQSAKFGRLLPELLNVPFFSAIRIHAGNTPADTEGCIIVGVNDEKGMVHRSRETERKLMARLQGVSNITIEVVR